MKMPGFLTVDKVCCCTLKTASVIVGCINIFHFIALYFAGGVANEILSLIIWILYLLACLAILALSICLIVGACLPHEGCVNAFVMGFLICCIVFWVGGLICAIGYFIAAGEADSGSGDDSDDQKGGSGSGNHVVNGIVVLVFTLLIMAWDIFSFVVAWNFKRTGMPQQWQ